MARSVEMRRKRRMMKIEKLRNRIERVKAKCGAQVEKLQSALDRERVRSS